MKRLFVLCCFLAFLQSTGALETHRHGGLGPQETSVETSVETAPGRQSSGEEELVEPALMENEDEEADAEEQELLQLESDMEAETTSSRRRRYRRRRVKASTSKRRRRRAFRRRRVKATATPAPTPEPTPEPTPAAPSKRRRRRAQKPTVPAPRPEEPGPEVMPSKRRRRRAASPRPSPRPRPRPRGKAGKPEEVEAGWGDLAKRDESFTIFVTGRDMDPDNDRIVVLHGDATCGVKNQYSKAAITDTTGTKPGDLDGWMKLKCNEIGSSPDKLACGEVMFPDRRWQGPGESFTKGQGDFDGERYADTFKFKVCVCSAGKSGECDSLEKFDLTPAYQPMLTLQAPE